MVATLTRIFGLDHLTLAEDVVQEALARALQTWPFHGIPQKPSAWIMRTARNLALDVVRRDKVFREKQPEILQSLEGAGSAPDVSGFTEQEIADDRLRLMFVCCHPSIPADIQAALALKTLCGFGISEISHAFLTSEAAIAKRLTRAKERIAEAGIRFEIPAGEELNQRLGGVLQTLYLLFNEGYKASNGERLMREDICQEAIRLTSLLAKHPAGDQPQTHALLALILLNTARMPARADASGLPLRLEDQDRKRWDQRTLAQGMCHLARSAAGEKLSRYHLEAGIAACHCMARDYASTNWRQILALYDRLVELDNSPVLALNRAVALAHVRGVEAGIAALQAIPRRATLDSYYLRYAVLGEFEVRRENYATAAGHFRRALELTRLDSEKRFLSKRIRFCENKARSAPAESAKRAAAA